MDTTYPSLNEWMNIETMACRNVDKSLSTYIHTHTYLLLIATTWVDFEGKMLSEISQTKKDICDIWKS